MRDPRTGKTIRTIKAHTGRITDAAISPDGTYAVSASDDRTLKVWDPATGEELRTLRGHDGKVKGCVVTPDGSYVVSSGWDKTVRVWDPATGEELRMLAGHPEACTDCALAPHGGYVVSASASTLELWDRSTNRRLHTLRGHTGAVTACVVSADGRYVISSGRDGTVRIWDARTGTRLRTLAASAPWPDGGVNDCTARHPGGPVTHLLPHHCYVCTRHRYWIGPPDIDQPATALSGPIGLDDIIRAQRHHQRLLQSRPGRHLRRRVDRICGLRTPVGGRSQ